MSGNATLRICFAAMAPALTEAASTHLKLQESKCESRENDMKETETVLKGHSFSSCRIVSEEERNQLIKTNKISNITLSSKDIVKHLNIVNPESIDNIIQLPLSKSQKALLLDNNINSKTSLKDRLASSLQSHQGQLIVQYKSFSKPNHSHLINRVVEDFQSRPWEDQKTLFDSLEIMNQPYRADEKSLNFNKSTEISSAVAPKQTNHTKDIGMVNGGDNEELEGNNSDAYVLDERGDASGKFRTLLEGLVAKAKKVDGGIVKEDIMGVKKSDISENTKLDKEIDLDQKMNDDMRRNAARKQTLLERKTDTLIRRLKRVKGKVVEAHTKDQLRQLYNHQHKHLQVMAKIMKKDAPGSELLKEQILSNDDVKSMSTAQLVRLVKAGQASKLSNGSLEVPSESGINGRCTKLFMEPALRVESSKVSERLNQRIHIAKAELDSDATASSSGGESGDEDEMPHPDIKPDVPMPPLIRRASWRWTVDRAAVVSRWTWLQAQVSDLEYRIRQQTQVYRQLRFNKGGVALGDPPSAVDLFRRIQGLPARESTTVEGNNTLSSINSPGNEISPCNVSAVLSNLDKQTFRLNQSLGNCLTPANSQRGSPASSTMVSPSSRTNPTADSPAGSSTTDADTTRENSPMVPSELQLFNKYGDHLHAANSPHSSADYAARCRPLKSYRKRKILKTVGLYKSNPKAARLSEVRCRCYPPSGTCPLCGGRYNNTQIVDADTQSLRERVALLDPAFHPVLSFPQDVPLSTHCHGLLKSGGWQNKPSSRKSRLAEYRRHNNILDLIPYTLPATKSSKGRRPKKNINSSAVISLTSKIKNKYENTKAKVKKTASAKILKKEKKRKRKAAKLARDSLIQHAQESDEEFELEYLQEEAATPGGPSPALASSYGSNKELKDINGPRKKKFVENCYDINDIEIPMSMATTSVEKPEYKEIITPKWREVWDSNLVQRCVEQTNGLIRELPLGEPTVIEETEELTDEQFNARHAKQEKEEKLRHKGFVGYAANRKHRTRSEAGLFDVKETDVPKESDTPSDSEQFQPINSMLNKSCMPAFFVHDEEPNHLSSRRRSSLHRPEPPLPPRTVDPWPRRMFPLSEEEFLSMNDDAPSRCELVNQRMPRQWTEPSGQVYVGIGGEDTIITPCPSPSPTPFTTPRAARPSEQSSESLSYSIDDQNDPEWIDANSSSKKFRRPRIIDDDPDDPEWSGSDQRKKGKNKR